MPVDSALLTEAAVVIDKGFQDVYQAGPPEGDPVGMLCKTINTTSKIVKAPINGLPARWREWLGERVYNDISRYALTFSNRTFECSQKMDVDDLEDDQYGGFRDIGTGMGEEALLWPRDLLVDALIKGPATNGFDGQFFFDVDHPVDPANSASAVYSNYVASGLALTSPNLATVIMNMKRYKAPNGRTLNLRPKWLIVPPQLEFIARAILAPKLVNGGEENIYAGLLEPVIIPELEVEPTAWYVLCEGRGLKPFVFSLRMSPRIDVLNRGTDLPVFAHNEVRWGGKARGNVVPALPFLIHKAAA